MLVFLIVLILLLTVVALPIRVGLNFYLNLFGNDGFIKALNEELADSFGKNKITEEVKDGKLKCIRSLLDEDFAGQNCCVIAMNRTFTQENPVISKKIVQAVQKAHSYMRDNSEEATKLLLEQGWNGGDYEMNVMLNNSLQFGLAQDFTQTTLTDVVGRYIRLGLITSMDNVDEVMELAWNPVL